MSLFEVNEVWIPTMGARVLDDIAFKVMLEQIRADLGPGSAIAGSVSRVLVTVKIDARSEEKAKTEATTKIGAVMRDRPFIVDWKAPLEPPSKAPDRAVVGDGKAFGAAVICSIDPTDTQQ